MEFQTYILRNTWRSKLLIGFILMQPFIDILTSLGMRYLESSITVGVVVRSLFLVVIMLDLFITKDLRERKTVLAYVFVLAVYCVMFLGLTLITPNTGSLFTNIKQLFKVVYFPLTLVYFYQMYKENKITISKELLTNVLFIYMLILFTGYVTGTGFSAYSNRDSGNKGWFFAGNDLTAIISLLIPIAFHTVVSQFSKEKPLIHKVLIALYFFLIVFSATHIGTKAIFLSTLAYFLIYGLYHGVKFLIEKKSIQVRLFGTSFILVLVMLISMKFTPIGESFNVLQFKFTQDTGVKPPIVVEPPVDQEPDSNVFTEEESQEMEEIVERPAYRIMNWLLSNRLTKAVPVHVHFMNESSATKAFGIGYFEETGKIDLSTQVEIDFLSIFYRHGVLGTIILLLPMACIIIRELRRALKNFSLIVSNTELLVLLLIVMYSLAFALITGHVIVSPAVSIYVSLILIYLAQSQDEAYSRAGRYKIIEHM